MSLFQQEFSPPPIRTITPSIPFLHYTTADGLHYSRRLHGKERMSAANSEAGIGFAQIIAIGDLELKRSRTKEEFEPFVRGAWMKLRHLCPWIAVRTSALKTSSPNSFAFTYEKSTAQDLSLVEKWADETLVWRKESLNHAEWESLFKEHYWKPSEGRYSLELHIAKNREKDRWLLILRLSGPHWLTDGRGLFPVYDQFFRYLQSTLDGSSQSWTFLPWGEEITRLPPSAIETIPDVGGEIVKPAPPKKLFIRPGVDRTSSRPGNLSRRITLSREQTKAFNFACKKHGLNATGVINSLLILADLETILRLAKEKDPELYHQLISQYETTEAFPVPVNIIDMRNFVSPHWAKLTGATGVGGLVNLGFPSFHDMNLIRGCMRIRPDGTFDKNLGVQTFWRGLCVETQQILREGSRVTPHMYHVNAAMCENATPSIRAWTPPPVGVIASSLGNLERLDLFTPFRPSVAVQASNIAFVIHEWHFGVRTAGVPSHVLHSWDYDGELTINIQGSSNFHTQEAWNTFGDSLKDTIEKLLSVKAVL
ncbi:hypothetical protein K435DRAFT_904621 [Dendrothele bispora CBS 962.96]|uniref:CoA-dependent acyltransferase n=1 Tax=Dendrothele bispora (strain CBS 962.96) TaxID=1314807 RepID=A0A4S8KKS1_DENBC|nr:hypothetical protein K435DRAFT_904621 [Dendrothele bispora CBS 962.96]